MLLVRQDVVMFKMLYDAAVHHMFDSFVAYSSKGDWLIVGWVCPIFFLVPFRSAVKLNSTACCDQNLSKCALNALPVLALRTTFSQQFGKVSASSSSAN